MSKFRMGIARCCCVSPWCSTISEQSYSTDFSSPLSGWTNSDATETTVTGGRLKMAWVSGTYPPLSTPGLRLNRACGFDPATDSTAFAEITLDEFKYTTAGDEAGTFDLQYFGSFLNVSVDRVSGVQTASYTARVRQGSSSSSGTVLTPVPANGDILKVEFVKTSDNPGTQRLDFDGKFYINNTLEATIAGWWNYTTTDICLFQNCFLFAGGTGHPMEFYLDDFDHEIT